MSATAAPTPMPKIQVTHFPTFRIIRVRERERERERDIIPQLADCSIFPSPTQSFIFSPSGTNKNVSQIFLTYAKLFHRSSDLKSLLSKRPRIFATSLS